MNIACSCKGEGFFFLNLNCRFRVYCVCFCLVMGRAASKVGEMVVFGFKGGVDFFGVVEVKEFLAGFHGLRYGEVLVF